MHIEHSDFILISDNRKYERTALLWVKPSIDSKVIAKITFEKMFSNDNSTALYIHFINCSQQPISILGFYLATKNNTVINKAYRIVNAKYHQSDTLPGHFTLDTDLVQYSYTNIDHELISLKNFNINAYLLPSQLELGWIVFNTKAELNEKYNWFDYNNLYIHLISEGSLVVAKAFE